MCFRGHDPLGWLYELPLFLCSIQLITIPLAAFTKGKIKEASLDFVLIFGILGAVFGTYFAGQNYGNLRKIFVKYLLFSEIRGIIIITNAALKRYEKHMSRRSCAFRCSFLGMRNQIKKLSK